MFDWCLTNVKLVLDQYLTDVGPPAAALAGPEADSFSLGVWRDLSTAGGFRCIADKWIHGVAQLAWSCNQDAAAEVRFGNYSSASIGSSSHAAAAVTAGVAEDAQQQQDDDEEEEHEQEEQEEEESRNSAAAAGATEEAQQQQAQGSDEDDLRAQFKNNAPPNFPSPCLLGSPFTTLAVTHNYHSLLHAEPREHPFSYIVWLDVLGPGSEMQVCIEQSNGASTAPMSAVWSRASPSCMLHHSITSSTTLSDFLFSAVLLKW
jgi:hypothetical protein